MIAGFIVQQHGPFGPSSPALRIGVFRVQLQSMQPLVLPAHNRTNVLRGSFGHFLGAIPAHRFDRRVWGK